MGYQPTKSIEDKFRIVLAVLRGEITIVETARRCRSRSGVTSPSLAASRCSRPTTVRVRRASFVG